MVAFSAVVKNEIDFFIFQITFKFKCETQFVDPFIWNKIYKDKGIYF